MRYGASAPQPSNSKSSAATTARGSSSPPRMLFVALLLATPAAAAWSSACTRLPLAAAQRRAACVRLESDPAAASDEGSIDREQPAPAPAMRPTGPGMSPCAIKVIGVGGGGGNTVNRMVAEAGGLEKNPYLEYIVCNTDAQALSASLSGTQVQLGKAQARGLGAGGVPAVGRASAIDASAEIEALVAGTDMVFVTAGMGGGTGSGAAPVVAALAQQAGCLTVGIVTKPFSFEGQRRMQQAVEAIAKFEQEARAHGPLAPCPMAPGP